MKEDGKLPAVLGKIVLIWQPASIMGPQKNKIEDPKSGNSKDCCRFGTWNVRTLTGKKELELIGEMNRYRLDVLGVSEGKIRENGIKTVESSLWAGRNVIASSQTLLELGGHTASTTHTLYTDCTKQVLIIQLACKQVTAYSFWPCVHPTSPSPFEHTGQHSPSGTTAPGHSTARHITPCERWQCIATTNGTSSLS